MLACAASNFTFVSGVPPSMVSVYSVHSPFFSSTLCWLSCPPPLTVTLSVVASLLLSHAPALNVSVASPLSPARAGVSAAPTLLPVPSFTHLLAR